MEKIESSKYRVILRSVVVSDDAGLSRVQVCLTLGGRAEEAEHIGENSDEAVFVSIAQATIDALNRLLPCPLDLRIEYVKQIKARPSAPFTMLSLVRAGRAGKEMLLSGSCPVVRSAHEAAARSILDALNRTIELILEQHELREQFGVSIRIIDPPAVSTGEPNAIQILNFGLRSKVNAVAAALRRYFEPLTRR
jgi:hypothetical protein